MALDTSPSPTSKQTHAAPTLSATNVDVTPEKGFFESLWSKVVDVYTNTFKADERIDRLQKMPAHQQEVADAVTSWRDYSNKVDSAIRTDVKTLSDAIGIMVEKSAEPFSTAMGKFNAAYKEITGYTASELTPEIRKGLTMDQRVKLSNVYTSLKDELAASKSSYVDGANAVNEIGSAVTDLIDLDSKQRAELKITREELAPGHPDSFDPDRRSKTQSSFGSTNLLESNLQALAPNIDDKLNAIYSADRAKAFADLATSEGVTTGSLEKIKEAITAAKGLLEGAGKFVGDVVAQAVATTEHLKKNEEIRGNILSGVTPADPSKKVAYVSQTTLDGLKSWFETKSRAAEAGISSSFAAVNTKEELEAWRAETSKFGVTCDQYRATLKAVGGALHPFTPLVDASKSAPAIFQDTVKDVKEKIEAAALHFVSTLPHDKAMVKLGELATLSAKVGKKATEDFNSGGALTPDERDSIIQVVDEALAEMKKTTKKSWV